jgi:hypothetical protein
MSTNSKENSNFETIFENNTTTSTNNVDISTFFNNIAESLKSLPSVSSDSDIESAISSAELQEIENFVDNFGNKSSFSRNDSKENLK